MSIDLLQNKALAHLLRDYRPNNGVSDELLAPDGSVRPVWRKFVEHLSELSPEAVESRFARGDRYLQDAGVFYRKYDTDGSAERDWPLNHIPVMIDGADWAEIQSGLIQRANLLEHMARDIYGENKLVAQGYLPPSIIAQNPAWLRPMVGATPAKGHFLNFISFEIGRGPDGNWWVLGNRTDAPSGAGFALENRVASSRIFPNFYARTDVHRLAGFFRAFQSALEDGNETGNGRIAILTPGPLNDVYFEHTYIAKHLGLLLTEGEDLSVRNGRVMVRTVDGLKPVSVLWRRLDGVSCDPIELDPESQLGTPGLVDAIRNQGVRMVNALGTGILETRALMSFMPKISEVLLDEPLKLPNIATWWCGQAAERRHVLANADRMMIGPAYSTRLPFDADDLMILGGSLDQAGKEKIEQTLKDQGRDLVGQEAVTLSTTPAWSNGRLVPRPMVMRVFLARTSEGWQAMPGGYARIGSDENTAALAMQQGGSVSDVWVVSDERVSRKGMIGQRPSRTRRQDPDALPSRAADNLFWLGRYVERAESNMRLFRAYHARLVEGLDRDHDLLIAMENLMAPGSHGQSAALAKSFEFPLESALISARRVRDILSVDSAMTLLDLGKSARRYSQSTVAVDEIPQKTSVLLRKMTGFAGLVHENFYRSTGWRFLSLGMSLERAANMAGILAALARSDAPDGALDLTLELGDSTMAHNSRFSGIASRSSVVDLLALDNNNPRAILYHLTRSKDQIGQLPGASDHGRLAPVQRMALKLHTGVAVQTPQALTPERLLKMQRDTWQLCDLLLNTYVN